MRQTPFLLKNNAAFAQLRKTQNHLKHVDMDAVHFTLIPWLCIFVGALISRRFKPNDYLLAALQHLAAGVVFAAAATEILPDIQHSANIIAILFGGAAGLLTMFGVKFIGSKFKGNMALFVLIGVDIFIDGLVLGIAFAAGAKQGALLLFALSLEILFLGLTIGAELKEIFSKTLYQILAVAIIGIALPIGAALGGPIHLLPEFWINFAYVFALIALLYLVTEELLVEAHEKPDNPLITSMFFVGFLGLLALEAHLAHIGY